MARPVGVGGGAEAVHGPGENYGQKRSELAHCMNDLRKAQRTGDEAGILSATKNLASAMNVNLGDVSGKSGSDLLKMLGDKLGISGEINADSLKSLQRTVTDHSKVMGLIGGIEQK